MTPSRTFMSEVHVQLDNARREMARALAELDDEGVVLARGRLADLAEIVERHTDRPLSATA